MTSKCPNCGVELEIIRDTNYSKATAVLSGAELSNQQLAALPWRQSQKKPSLATILVNETTLAIPIAKLLYDRLKSSATKGWKLGEVTYKLSRNDEGTEWLQRWSPMSQ